MTQTVVHVGMMKAASTTLQESLFARHSEIENIWKPNLVSLMRQMINLEDNELPIEEIRSYINMHRKTAETNNKKILLASNEQIAGLPTLSFAAKRIKSFFPNAKILLCIREQKSLIESYYLYQNRALRGIWGVPKKYGDLPISFADFFSFHVPVGVEKDHKTQKFMQIAWRLQYSKTAQLYENIFGRDRVMVLPIEMIDREPKIFAERLETFCGIDARETCELLLSQERKNMRPESGAVTYERWRRLLPTYIEFSKLFPFGGRLRDWIKELLRQYGGPEIEWSKDMIDRVEQLYAVDNAKLSARYALDLAAYGYPFSALPDSVKVERSDLSLSY